MWLRRTISLRRPLLLAASRKPSLICTSEAPCSSAAHSPSTDDSVTLRVAVIGSGPAGFYFTGSLMRLLGAACTVDMYDKQPLPFGLVRFGVAPDHPEVKNCTHQFEQLFARADGRLRFFGNVPVGDDGGGVSIAELTDWYDAVVLACGADAERRLGVPNEWATNCLSAKAFVGWYNGQPEHAALAPSFDTDTAVVLGQGNVALDVARVLLSPVDRLRATDAPEAVIEALLKSRIQHVVLAGRRGPLQVAFTIKELRELVNLPGTVPVLDTDDFEGVEAAIQTLPRPKKRLIELLLKTAMTDRTKTDTALNTKTWSMLFKRSPTQILVDQDNAVSGVEFAVNQLVERDGAVKAVATDELHRIHCGLAVRSIGYQTVVLPGVPFDAVNNVVRTTDGVHVTGGDDDETASANLYACGWCSKGAVGVIATTQMEAKRCAEAVDADVKTGRLAVKAALRRDRGGDAVGDHWETTLTSRGVRWVSWRDWLRIDSRERERGSAKGKPREKFTSVDDILRLVDEAAANGSGAEDG